MGKAEVPFEKFLMKIKCWIIFKTFIVIDVEWMMKNLRLTNTQLIDIIQNKIYEI